MPKLSKGLPYFNLNTDLDDDKRIKLLKAEFGIKGFGIWIELLRQIYADEGYFLEWDSDTKLLFASDVGESGGLVDEVIQGSVKRGLFDESVFNQFSVLTSKHIQEKYFNAIKRRETDIEVDTRYLVIPEDVPIIAGNVNIKLLNVNIKKQSRVEKSKVEKSKPDNAGARGEPPDGEDLPGHVKGCPIPAPLQVEGFTQRYQEFCEYLETEKKQTISIRRVESHFRRLIELQEEGNPPLAVMDQTMNAGNKSFYPLKDRKFKNQDDGPTNSDEIVRNTIEQVSKLTFEDA